MRPDILIVGQGLAGTMLAWEFERAGISFVIADRGHATAATSVAAGIINPITGRRLVKSWRYETLFPAARECYRGLEAAVGQSLWQEMRMRRLFADDRERAAGADPQRRAELAPFIEAADETGWWVRNVARIDLGTLLSATRARWLAAGKLRVEAVEPVREIERHELVIDCRGFPAAESTWFDFVPWEFSKGEILDLSVAGMDPNVVLNRRMWVVPTGPGTAVAGATHEPGVKDCRPSAAGRAAIETAVRAILGNNYPFALAGHRAGVRVNLPDKRPAAGRHPRLARLGMMNALAAKGALWAPMLARQWVNHLTEGVPFDPEIDVKRFVASGRV